MTNGKSKKFSICHLPLFICHLLKALAPASCFLLLGQLDLSSHKNYDFDLGRCLFLG
jgi:hypothetical protein